MVSSVNWHTVTEGLKLLGLIVCGNLFSMLLADMFPAMMAHNIPWLIILGGVSFLLILDTEAPAATNPHNSAQKNIYDR